MGGQVLGGGVVVLVAVVLWMVYLLPSWHSRHQYNAAERNAVRLNQALRVLAETSQTPDEVRLELNARTALAQQKLARRAQAERESAELEGARAELETARAEAEVVRAEAEIARAQARAEAEIARARAAAGAAAARERAAAEAAAAASAPAVRRARARRRARLICTLVGIAAIGFAGWGAVIVVTTGSQLLLWAGAAVAVACGGMLQRMSTVQRRAAGRVVAVADGAQRSAAAVQDVALGSEREAWTPRELPRPLTASAGSRAAAVLDAAAAREDLRRAALDEAMRERAEAAAPPSLDEARRTRAAAAEPDFAAMGRVDDAEIEAHVRRLLERRASGQ
ncbi:large exoprotein [Microbacterium saccharophilum]|uniref:Large exoprotein n=1 Tax=Microbacterium saccharophilum TaxID=1213358 RepID=A0A5C8I6M5_9MICO|nr:large exoprotein [Microbacterium saccharophilum]TXK14356.1 large exoprotein [Microbacterium saccharophilum]